MRIRPIDEDDAPAIAEIYAPIVTDTTVSFELEAPDAAEMARRIRHTTATHPWFVATIDDVVAGYAYGCTHRAREGYRFSVETSVYLDPKFHRQGIAGKLYSTLFTELETRGFRNAFAGVTLPNDASVGFHRSFGFEPIGVFPRIGFKFERWLDVAWFHRPIGG